MFYPVSISIHFPYFLPLLSTNLVWPEALIPGALASQRNRSVPHGTQLLATCAQGALVNRLDLGEIIQQESAIAYP